MMWIRIFMVISLLGVTSPVFAQSADTPSGYPVPRFVSLKVGVAHGRSGPSTDYPIAWRYTRQALPMQVIAEAPDWRYVRDPLGEETWMHHSLLSGRRTVFALAEVELFSRPAEDSTLEAVAEEGAILDLERCADGWCRLAAQGQRGWARTDNLWGITPRDMGEEPTETRAETDSLAALSDPLVHDTASAN